MGSSEYNPFVDHIVVKLKCGYCGSEFSSEPLRVPGPDWSSESHHNSIETDFCETICDQCGMEIDLTLSTGIYGGEVQTEGAEVIDIEEYFPDSEIDDAAAQQTFGATQSDIEKCLAEMNPLSVDVKHFLYKLLYANAITSMESYLSETLRREVFRSEMSIRRFIETYKPFCEDYVALKDIFSKKEQLPAIISGVLKELMYHNLGKIKPIFKEAIDVDLGTISSLCKAVDIRHDLVHRNGKNHEGIEHNICEQDVRDVLKQVQEMITSIDEQLKVHRQNELLNENNATEPDE